MKDRYMNVFNRLIQMEYNKIILYTISMVSPFLLGSCVTVGIEKPKYTVVEKQSEFEIRQYQSQIIAETTVEAEFDDAGDTAFQRLFDYISGSNQTKKSIAMTAPVNQKSHSEKIAMTAPVNQQISEGNYSISFLMPSKYTMETLPEPLNPQVVIREIPSQKIAAIRYSGTWSQERYKAHQAKLEDFIREKGLQAKGEPIFARYDPPFQLWFLRRNEVLIPIY